MPTNPDPDLMRIFDFTAADLEANRAGRLTERQMQKLSERRKKERALLILLGIMFPMLFLVFYFERFLQTLAHGIEAWEITLLFWVIICLIGIFFGGKKLASDVKSGTVDFAQGTIKRWQGRGGGTINIAKIWLEIDRQENTGLKEYFKNVPKGTEFRVHYAPKSEKLVSIEMIDQ